MKKFKLIGLALLASTFGLTSCDLPDFIKDLIPSGQKEEQGDKEEKGEVVSVKIKNEVSVITDETVPFKLIAHVEVKNKASKEVTWSSSNDAVATVAADGTVTPKLGGTGSVTFTAKSVADSSKSDSLTVEVVAVPGIASVSVTEMPDVAYLYRSSELKAVVAGKGQYNHGVIWSSSNEEIAKVDESGVVSYLKAGEVVITATSKVDSTKSGSVTLDVVDGGLHPEYIAKGYEYSKAFPAEAINEFAGTVAEFPAFEAEEGFYLASGSLSSGKNYRELVFEYTYANANSAYKSLSDGDFFYFYDSYNELECYLDPEQILEVDFAASESPDGYDVLTFTFWHASDWFKGSAEDTEDEAWKEDIAEVLSGLNIDLPFVKLGADYDFDQEDAYSIEISDSCVDFNKLNGYADVLIENGYDEDGDDLEGYVYTKPISDYAYAEVQFGFTNYGNTIVAANLLYELDEFPATAVAAYVDSFPSKYDVPSFVKSGAKFTYDEYSSITLEKEEIKCVTVSVSSVDEDDCLAYGNLLLSNDYQLISAHEHYLGSTTAEYRKGKIGIQAEIDFDYHVADDDEIAAFEAITEEDYEAMSQDEKDLYDYQNEYYWYYGTFPVFDYDEVSEAYISIYYFEPGMEDPGLYIYESAISIDKKETFAIKPVHHEIDSELAVSYVSSDPTVATVDENGVITGEEFGEAVITASVTDPELGELSDSVVVTVEHKTTMADVAAEINAVLESFEIEDRIELPEMDNFVFGEFDASDFEDEGVFNLMCTTTETEESYCEKLEAIGYTISIDDYGYPIANNGVFEIEPYVFYGDMYLFITYLGGAAQPEEFSDEVVFSELGFANADDVSNVSSEHASISFSAGSNSNGPKYYDTGTAVRVYPGNEITVAAGGDDGVLYEIDFTLTVGKTGVTGLSASVGSYESSTGVWTAPEGGVASVTFTVQGSGGHYRITQMVISGYGIAGEGGGGGEQEEVDAAKIMNDVGLAGWGYVEDGDFTEPDEDGVIESNWTIGWEVESPEDSEACLNGVLNEFIADENFPDYLTVIEGPAYTANAIEDSIGVSSVYLATADYSYILYMYAYCYEGEVSIVFMAGPYSAFAG